MSYYRLQRKIFISWSSNFAYAMGLIASDGNLSLDRRHISFTTAEEEMILNFKRALSLKNKIGRHARGGEKRKNYYHLSFGDKVFYNFLNSIGLCSAKSKTIKFVKIPDKFFADFLRGLFDGDGTFYTFWDRRWPNSFVYHIEIASASLDFILWLKERLGNLYVVKGIIRKGDGVFVLRYVKGDTRKIFSMMYNSKCTLFLSRKYNKMIEAFEMDDLMKIRPG